VKQGEDIVKNKIKSIWKKNPKHLFIADEKK
jgi:hypothetical protein